MSMISHEQKPYRLDSVIMRPAITICQGTSAPRARYRPRKSLRHHSCRHHICPPINKQERAVALLVSNCKTSIATTRYPNCFPSYWGRRQGRSPFIIYWLVVLTIPYIMEKKKCSNHQPVYTISITVIRFSQLRITVQHVCCLEAL